MNNLPQFCLTLLGFLFCVGDVAALGYLLTWQERAASPQSRRHRLWRGVVPGAVVLISLLLTALTQLMLLWSRQ